jgi:hypothetical protein
MRPRGHPLQLGEPLTGSSSLHWTVGWRPALDARARADRDPWRWETVRSVSGRAACTAADLARELMEDPELGSQAGYSERTLTWAAAYSGCSREVLRALVAEHRHEKIDRSTFEEPEDSEEATAPASAASAPPQRKRSSHRRYPPMAVGRSGEEPEELLSTGRVVDVASLSPVQKRQLLGGAGSGMGVAVGRRPGFGSSSSQRPHTPDTPYTRPLCPSQRPKSPLSRDGGASPRPMSPNQSSPPDIADAGDGAELANSTGTVAAAGMWQGASLPVSPKAVSTRRTSAADDSAGARVWSVEAILGRPSSNKQLVTPHADGTLSLEDALPPDFRDQSRSLAGLLQQSRVRRAEQMALVYGSPNLPQNLLSGSAAAARGRRRGGGGGAGGNRDSSSCRDDGSHSTRSHTDTTLQWVRTGRWRPPASPSSSSPGFPLAAAASQSTAFVGPAGYHVAQSSNTPGNHHNHSHGTGARHAEAESAFAQVRASLTSSSRLSSSGGGGGGGGGGGRASAQETSRPQTTPIVVGRVPSAPELADLRPGTGTGGGSRVASLRYGALLGGHGSDHRAIDAHRNAGGGGGGGWSTGASADGGGRNQHASQSRTITGQDLVRAFGGGGGGGGASGALSSSTREHMPTLAVGLVGQQRQRRQRQRLGRGKRSGRDAAAAVAAQ